MSCIVTGHIKTSWLPTLEPCQSRRSFRNTLVTLLFEGVKLQWGRCSWGFDLLMCKPTRTHCTYSLYNSVFIARYKASNYQKKQCYFQVLHCVQTSKIMETFYFRFQTEFVYILFSHHLTWVFWVIKPWPWITHKNKNKDIKQYTPWKWQLQPLPSW